MLPHLLSRIENPRHNVVYCYDPALKIASRFPLPYHCWASHLSHTHALLYSRSFQNIDQLTGMHRFSHFTKIALKYEPSAAHNFFITCHLYCVSHFQHLSQTLAAKHYSFQPTNLHHIYNASRSAIIFTQPYSASISIPNLMLLPTTSCHPQLSILFSARARIYPTHS